MARVTVEDCLEKIDNRFSLVHLTAKRVRQLREGAPPHLESKNKEVVVALREIAAGSVYSVSAEEAEVERAAERKRACIAAAEAQAARVVVSLVEDGDEDAEEEAEKK